MLIIIFILFFTDQAGMRKNYRTALFALPESALVFYSGNDLPATISRLNETEFWNSLRQIEAVKNFSYQITFIDSVVSKHSTLKKHLKEQHIVLSVHRTSRNKLDILLLTQGKGKIKADDLIALTKDWTDGKLVERTFRGHTIYEYQLGVQQSRLAFALTEGLLILSKNPLLVEEALSKWVDNKGLQRSTVLDNDFKTYSGNYFVNYRQLSSLVQIFSNEEHKAFTDQMGMLAATADYVLDFSSNSLVLRGSMRNTDTSASFLRRFHSQRPGRMDFPRVVPGTTSVFFAYHTSDINAYLSHYIGSLKASGKYKSWEAQKQAFEKKHSLQIEKDILPLIDNEFVLTLSEPFYENLFHSSNLFLKCKNIDEAVSLFNNFFLDAGENKDQGTVYNGLEVYKSSMGEFSSLLLGELFELPAEVYFVKIREYLVFSYTRNSLHRIIDAYQQNHTLHTSSDFNKLTEKLASEANFFMYINPNRLPTLPERFLNDYWLDNHQSNNVFMYFGTFAYQIVNNNNSYYNEMVMEFSAGKSETADKIWEIELDTTYSVTPFIVKNHRDNSWEILLYDDMDKLYLISRSGEILWKRQLESKIVGDIYQVDFYNNNKLQLLFTTETHLQMIDRLGRNVANYPIRLPAKASSGIGVSGIKLDKNLLYYVGTENNQIYGYNVTGKPLSSWSGIKINGKLQYPVKTFKQGLKTFIYAVTDRGYVYIWDAKGSQVVSPFVLSSLFTNPPEAKVGIDKDDTYIIVLDTLGNTFFLYLNGKAEMQNFGKLSSNAFFDLVDINKNKESELLFFDRNIWTAFSAKGQILNSISMERSASIRPEYLFMNDNFYLAYVNKEFEKLYLTDISGRIEDNFPIKANAPFVFFDINKDGKPEIIGGYDNKLFLSRF